jgi:predicted phage terminase large subunit-like protein
MIQGLHADVAMSVLCQAAANSFVHFQRLVHPIVSGEDYIHAVHSRAIAQALQRVAMGEVQRLLIAVPPRHFKSYLSSVAFPAFLLGLDPKLRIVCASYGSDLAETFAGQSRDIMRSPEYAAIFPRTVLSTRFPPLQKLRTTRNGYRVATSIGGVLTGVGADIAIIDDPIKAAEASSQVVRDQAREWFKSSLLTRFDKPNQARVVVLMQRLHQDDLLGRLKEDPGWEVLELPGQVSSKTTLQLGHGKTHILHPGDILFPERFDGTALKQLRFDLGEAGYAAQILQQPTPIGGHLFDLAKAQRFDWSPKIDQKQCQAMILSVDCAAAATVSADYTALTLWGVKGETLFLLDAARGKWALPQTLEKVRSIRKTMHGQENAILIENGGAGLPLAQTLRSEGHEQVWPWAPREDKIVRAEYANLLMEQGRLRLPKAAPWLEAMEQELTSFPHGKNDDYVDSLSQVPWNLQGGLANSLWLTAWPLQSKAA